MSALDDVVLADEDRDAVCLRPLDEVGEVGEPALGHEVGPGPVPGGQRAADDLLGLGDVEPALGLGAPAQRDVGEPDVVGQPRVGGVVDRRRHARKARPATARAMTVRLATTQKASTARRNLSGSMRARNGAATA